MSAVRTKVGAPVETITTSASHQQPLQLAPRVEDPPTWSASCWPRSGERLVTSTRSTPSTRSALAESVPILPAPTSRMARPLRSPKIFSTRSTATCDIEVAPRPMLVSVRTRLAVAKARLQRRDM